MNCTILRSSRAGERIRRDEPLGQPDDAHLEAAAQPQLFGVAERDLDAAAADVDHDRRPAHHVDAVDRGEVDEARLLGAGDHAGPDAGLLDDAGEELAPVLRFARGAGGGRKDLVDAVRLGDPPELRQREQRRRSWPARSGSCRRARRRRDAPSPSRDRSPRTTGPPRTRTTIMWTEFVPMSMAARRMGHNCGGKVRRRRRDARVRAYNPCFGRERRPASRPRIVAEKSYHEAPERSVTACCTAGCAPSNGRCRMPPAATARPCTRRGSPRGACARRCRSCWPTCRRRRRSGWRGGFRRITRALGPVREIDVTLGVLEASRRAVSRCGGEPAGAWRSELRAERDASVGRRCLAASRHVDADRLVAQLEAIAGMADAQPAGRRAVGQPRGAGRAHRPTCARTCSTAVAAAGALYAPEPLHVVRIATKKLRYAMELAHEFRLLPSTAAAAAARAHAGHARAACTICRCSCERLAAAQATLPSADAGVAADLAHVMAALDDECRRLHAEYVAGRDPLLAAVERGARNRHGRSGARRRDRARVHVRALSACARCRSISFATALRLNAAPNGPMTRSARWCRVASPRLRKEAAALKALDDHLRRHPHQPAHPREADGRRARSRALAAPAGARHPVARTRRAPTRRFSPTWRSTRGDRTSRASATSPTWGSSPPG